VPKVGRAGGRDSSKGRGTTRRKTVRKAAPSMAQKLRNQAAAQLRAARYRTSHALRLAGLAVLVLAVSAAALLAAFGRLGDIGAHLAAGFEAQLERAGYTVAWLDVSGAERVSAEEIAAIIGARPGTGLASINPHAAREALEELSWVETAIVLRRWPNRITVIVTEREPFALWQYQRTHHVIDRSGVIVDDADPADFSDLPRVTGAGANLAASAFLDLLARHPDIAAHATHAVRVGERRWSLRLESGGEVLLPETSPATALAALSAMHAERGILEYEAQIIDLRTEGEMVLRPWPDRASQAAGRGA